jgi:SPP1 gp7 family putative phage head morphogenesis protein
MKRTNAYWQRRSEQRLTAVERASLPYLKQVYSIYDESQRRTVNDIKKMYQTYYRDNGFDTARLKAIAPSGDLLRFQRDMKAAGLLDSLPANYQGRLSRLELLNAQMWGEVKKAALSHNDAETATHARTVLDGYYRSIFDVSKGIGQTPAFTQLNTKTIEKVLTTKFHGENYSQRIWGNTDKLADSLRATLAQAIATGQSQAKTVREVRERFGVNQSNAQRLVQTETNYFENAAEMESFIEMGIEKWRFLATLDGRTSAICREEDGKIYKVGEGPIPPLHPYCRSTITAVVDGYEPTERIARDASGKNYYVSGKTNYNDWVQNFTPLAVLDAVKSPAMGGGSGLKSQPENLANYDSATKEWLDGATPGSGRVVRQQERIIDGRTYRVDDTHVLMQPSDIEIDVARFINEIFGGNVTHIAEIKVPLNIKNPDYMWKRAYWDLKESRNIDTLHYRIEKAIKQTNGGGMILDITNNPSRYNQIRHKISETQDGKRKQLGAVIIIKHNGKTFELLEVLKLKK